MTRTAPTSATHRVDLAIGGMTCASCAGRIERKLNRMDGVTATVNYATETATVAFAPEVTVGSLIAAVEATGYTADRPARPDSPLRLVVAAVLTVPLMVLAMVPGAQVTGWPWIALALATPVVTWCAWPFHRAAARSARHGSAGMDTLISLGAIVSYAWSVGVLVSGSAGTDMDVHLLAPRGSGGSSLYFEVGAALTTFLLAGRYLEGRAKRRGGAALRALATIGAKDAAVLRHGTEIRVGVADLAVGDRFVVRPGETIATDGVLEDGAGSVDASTVTGESMPVEVTAGAPLIGGTTNLTGRLIVRATRVGAQTHLAQITKLVTEAQSGKAAVARLADRIAGVFVPAVLAVAALTFTAWWALGFGLAGAFTAAVAVLIVACPCALGLATPTALLAGTGRGAQLGILIRGPQVLESTGRLDTIVLDKTGTVTTGRMTVTAVAPAPGETRESVLRLAAAVEHASEHPIAAAIVAAYHGTPPPVRDFRARPGHGAIGTVDGVTIEVGRSRTASTADMVGTASMAGMVEADRPQAASAAGVVEIIREGVPVGTITVTDTVKPDAADAITDLRRLGLRPVLLTGDSPAAAEAAARAVGIDDVAAGVLPVGKVEVIRRLQAEGHRVAMVGDGVNDAAALAAADLGIAMGTGTDAAIAASDVTLVRPELSGAPEAIRLARATYRTIITNLVWAFAYNVAAIPLAAAGLVTPVLAAAAMAASSLFVVGNSLRLTCFRR